MATEIQFSRINSLLLIAIILVNGYVIFMPMVPNVLFTLQKDTQKIAKLEQTIRSQPISTSEQPTENTVIIPSMLLTQPIHEGKTARTLREGLWRIPSGSTPDRGGNTIIVGHRFTYNNPKGTLYHLDKVKTGDSIGIFWDDKKYIYKVQEVKVVDPSQIEIEKQTPDARLTMYTCTPLWLPRDRLVIIATLEKESS